MSETIAAPDTSGSARSGSGRTLHVNLGVGASAFMVVAAAAPLGVIGLAVGARSRPAAKVDHA
jgi:hypothetical protein